MTKSELEKAFAERSRAHDRLKDSHTAAVARNVTLIRAVEHAIAAPTIERMREILSAAIAPPVPK